MRYLALFILIVFISTVLAETEKKIEPSPTPTASPVPHKKKKRPPPPIEEEEVCDAGGLLV
jgi:hypothetical protein